MQAVIYENIPLAPLTTMKVGGPARYFAQTRNENEAVDAIRFAAERGLDIFILGGGSNIIVSDDGFPGLVIQNKIAGFRSEMSGGKVKVHVGSGEIWDEFVRRAVKAGWQGIENLSGVPGTVGSAPVQNIGAYGQSVEDVITGVRAIDMSSGDIKIFGREDCGFRYRDSIFRSEQSGRYFITEVVFELLPGGIANVSAYPDIEKYFERRDEPPSLPEMRKAVLEIRARKGMLIMPGYESYMSVGSFFKNPVISGSDFERLKPLMGTETGGGWFWEQPARPVTLLSRPFRLPNGCSRKAASPFSRSEIDDACWESNGARAGGKDGLVKISAGRLIELSGFGRGYREGNVGISPRHSLAIINLGGAASDEIARFARKIQSAVLEKSGIALEPEAQFVGKFADSW